MKTLRNILLSFVCWICMSSLVAQREQVSITGHQSDYATDSLCFYTYSDYLTKIQEPLARCKVAQDGRFQLTFKISSPTRIYAEIGAYRCQLLAEPGVNYEIVLPPKLIKTSAQLLNPFFEPLEYYVGIANQKPDDLNLLIYKLDQDIDSFLEVHQYELQVRKIMRPAFEHFKKKVFQQEGSTYLKDYRYYRFAQLDQFINPASKPELFRKHLLDRPVLIQNPAYMDFIHNEFKLIFGYYRQTLEDDSLLKAIQDADLKSLRHIMSRMENLTEASLRDFLLAMGLYDGFYAGHYSASEVISMMKLLEDDPTCPVVVKKLVGNMQTQITQLLPGYTPPGFALFDQDNHLTYLQEFEGKYVYLSFVSKDSYPFRQDLELLKLIQKEFDRNLEIVSITIDEDFDAFTAYMEKYGCNWIFLDLAGNQQLIKSYKARSIPTYFLIDPYGKIIRAPSLSPQEDFQNDFYSVLNRRD